MKSSLRRIIGAKAALYTNGDEMKLIEAGVREYVSNVPEGSVSAAGRRNFSSETGK
ncbi:MAG: hypothetical protein BLITH_0915 [Brockia lithotrophica]|uniref:Uncharacterized protein n=1 Tax=Brockia lithotrophica TaxID=933949 RepID=A0A2T5G975_9BACL|nr:MAG: hypothetical protein BLITH_0915 [Brockia lithotrophica]